MNQKPPFESRNSNSLNSRFLHPEIEVLDDKKLSIEEKEALSKELLKETRLIGEWLYQKTPNTRKAYETDLKKFLKFYPGKMLKDFTSGHLSFYLKEHPQHKESTKARIKASLSSLFKYCVRVGYLDKNLTENLDPIKVPDRTQFKVLSQEEIKRMIDFEKNPRNKFFMALLFKTGLRISEAISLTFENFKKRDGKYFLVVVGKGNKTRTIRLDQKYYEWAMEFKVDNGGKSLPNKTSLFRSKNTLKSMTKVNGWKIIKNAAKNAGLSDEISPHWLRHSHATISLHLGDDLRVIQHTLGHESIVTTTKYVKVNPDAVSGTGFTV